MNLKGQESVRAYLGLNQVVIAKYLEPSTDVEYTLATGTGSDPYAGLDGFGRIIDLQWKQSATKLVWLKHGYDQASNRLYRRDEVARSQTTPQSFDELYAYDGLHRLTSFDRGQLNSSKRPIRRILTAVVFSRFRYCVNPGDWSCQSGELVI